MTTKTAALDARQAQNVMNKLFQFIQEIHNESHTPQMSEFEQHFTRNFELMSNGTVISHNLNDYTKRVEKLRSKYSKMKITATEAPIFTDNKIATNYTIAFTPKAGGQPVNIEIMAFATFDGERLSKWHQVAHEKGTGKWDK